MLLKELISFLKNPNYQVVNDLSLKKKIDFFLKLLGLSIAISLLLGMSIGALESFANIDMGSHAVEQMFDNYSIGFIFLAAVVFAPLLEELLFRGPLVFFSKSRHFKFIFYLLTLAFGFYHLINFDISLTVLLLSPLLVAPQVCIGAILGFIRIRFGLLWAILLHAFYNLILIGPIILLKILNIPLE